MYPQERGYHLRRVESVMGYGVNPLNLATQLLCQSQRIALLAQPIRLPLEIQNTSWEHRPSTFQEAFPSQAIETMDELDRKLAAITLVSVQSETKFLDVFKKGSGARSVFADHILPFLSMDDVISGSAVCRQMNTMCRSYTVGDVLDLYSMHHVARDHKMKLGQLVLGSLSRKYLSRKTPHRRYVRDVDTAPFWARVYHPSLVKEIVLAMVIYFNRHGIEFTADIEGFDWSATADTTTPVLVAAYYGDGTEARSTNVVTVLRYLLMKQGNTKLILEEPLHSPRYWYNCLFGDPCERVTKTLVILTRSEDGSKQRRLCFGEDEEINIALRAERKVDDAVELLDVYRADATHLYPYGDSASSENSYDSMENLRDELLDDW